MTLTKGLVSVVALVGLVAMVAVGLGNPGLQDAAQQAVSAVEAHLPSHVLASTTSSFEPKLADLPRMKPYAVWEEDSSGCHGNVGDAAVNKISQTFSTGGPCTPENKLKVLKGIYDNATGWIRSMTARLIEEFCKQESLTVPEGVSIVPVPIGPLP